MSTPPAAAAAAAATRHILSSNKFYECAALLQTAVPFGAEVIFKNSADLMSTDMSDDANSDFFSQIKEDLLAHRFLLFRNQQSLTGKQQVDFSNRLGKVHSTFYKHPKSPHPDIFRVSNDETEGCTNVGRSGWHIDGTFLQAPFLYQTMHFPSVIPDGQTAFVPLKELYELQDAETQQRWNKLWMVTDRFAHPLVYKHPTRGDTTLAFHCGLPFVQGWFVDEGENDDIKRKAYSQRTLLPSAVIQEEITKAINDSNLVLKMSWQEGDFAINDNVGLAHYAVPGTQKASRSAGLRILHRTTVLDENERVPTKEDGRTSFIC
jgi:taurine dioxygenase